MAKNIPIGDSLNLVPLPPYLSGIQPTFNPSDIPSDGMCLWTPYVGVACARGGAANALAADVGNGAKWAYALAGVSSVVAMAIVLWPKRRAGRRS